LSDCHLFSISRQAHEDDDTPLKVCVAMKDQLMVIQYESVGFMGSGGGKFKKVKVRRPNDAVYPPPRARELK